MKVLFISHEAARTGATFALLQEIRILKLNCPDIIPSVLFLDDGDLRKDFSELCTVYNGWSRLVCVINRILRRLSFKYEYFPYLNKVNKGDFDCIYANSVASLHAGYNLKKKLGIPLLAHVHEAECLMHLNKISSEEISCVDSFITVSNFASNNLVNNYGIPQNKIVIQTPISFWVDRYMKNELLIDPYKYDNSTILIGCFINNEWFKSVDLLPVLIKHFYKKLPDVKCKFVIVGNLSDEVHWRIKHDLSKIGYLDNVIWFNKLGNPINLHSRLDILLLLSKEESFSLVAQESALLKTPVVGFRDSIGIEEWIGEEGGRWAPYLDIESLAKNLIYLCTNSDLRKELGKNANGIIQEQYKKCIGMESVISLIRNYRK